MWDNITDAVLLTCQWACYQPLADLARLPLDQLPCGTSSTATAAGQNRASETVVLPLQVDCGRCDSMVKSMYESVVLSTRMGVRMLVCFCSPPVASGGHVSI